MPNLPIAGKDYTGQDIKDSIREFIQNGGGYISHCAWAFGTTEYLYLYVFEDTSQMR